MYFVGLGARCQGKNDENVCKQTTNSIYYNYSSKSILALIIKGDKTVCSQFILDFLIMLKNDFLRMLKKYNFYEFVNSCDTL